jgi:hypothetical protein
MTPALSPDARTLLTAVRALIAAGWCQHASARDAAGRRVPYHAADARAWSLHGAMFRADLDVFHGQAHGWEEARRALAAAGCEPGTVLWNDAPDRTQADVLALLDRALGATAAEPAAEASREREAAAA